MPNSPFKLSMIAGAISAAFAPTLYAASAGKVDFATPGVNAIGPNGQARPVTKGTELQTGETIDTGAGRAQLRFTDGGMVSLQPQTQFKLESYGYDKDDASKNSAVMNLLKGGLRTITGLIGKTNRQGYKLQTSTATVGIRGTEFSITTFPDGSVLFNCTDGTIDVTNQAGSSTVGAGQSARVTSSTSTPTTTTDKPYLPAAVTFAQTQLVQPTNPVQDAQPGAATLLTGTFGPLPISGEWRTIALTGYPSSNPPQGLSPTGMAFDSNALGIFTVAPSGHLTSFGFGYASPTDGRTISLAGGLAQSFGNDGVMAWGRWTGAISDPSVCGEGGCTDSNPLHYVVGMPVTNMPTSGVATYNQYGGTPVSCSGACGTITTSSSLTVNFGNLSASTYSLSMTNTAGGVSLSGTGNLSFTGSNNANFSNNFIQMTGTGTIGSGYGSVNGFLAGPGASHAGAVFGIGYTQGTGYGGTFTQISGAAVYKK